MNNLLIVIFVIREWHVDNILSHLRPAPKNVSTSTSPQISNFCPLIVPAVGSFTYNSIDKN